VTLRTDFSTAEDSPGFALWRVTNRWQAAQRLTLTPFGLTHVQFVLLASLTWLQADEPVTQHALATHAGIDPMMTSQVLRALESAGHVERRPHPTDRRARELVITPAGRAVANDSVRAVEACDRAFFAVLGEGRHAFAHALTRLSASPQHQLAADGGPAQVGAVGGRVRAAGSGGGSVP